MGPRVLVTGATDGIGRQTAIDLAARGARVVVHGRSADKVRDVVAAVPGAEGITADLASLAAVRGLAAEAADRFPDLEVLLENAGVYEPVRQLTVDGYERTFAINHLAHFLLALELLPVLLAQPAPRVVVVASMVHQGGRIHWDDLDLARGYDAYDAYAQSKLANVMFAGALARREPRIAVNSLHPGVIATKLLRVGFGAGGAPVGSGSATSVRLALDPELARVSGGYFASAEEARASAAGRDPAAQDRLWALSEARVGRAR